MIQLELIRHYGPVVWVVVNTVISNSLCSFEPHTRTPHTHTHTHTLTFIYSLSQPYSHTHSGISDSQGLQGQASAVLHKHWAVVESSGLFLGFERVMRVPAEMEYLLMGESADTLLVLEKVRLC